MRVLHILLAVIVTHVSMAENLEGHPPVRERTIAEVKLELKSETKPLKRFYLVSDLVRRYASEPLTNATPDEYKASAVLLLKMSERYKKDWTTATLFTTPT